MVDPGKTRAGSSNQLGPYGQGQSWAYRKSGQGLCNSWNVISSTSSVLQAQQGLMEGSEKLDENGRRECTMKKASIWLELESF